MARPRSSHGSKPSRSGPTRRSTMVRSRDRATSPVAARRAVLKRIRDEDIEHVAENMGEQQIRRLPVLDRDKRLVGIISLGDVAVSAPIKAAGQAVAEISRPGGKHDQTLH